jgi:hypothetical protein
LRLVKVAVVAPRMHGLQIWASSVRDLSLRRTYQELERAQAAVPKARCRRAQANRCRSVESGDVRDRALSLRAPPSCSLPQRTREVPLLGRPSNKLRALIQINDWRL